MTILDLLISIGDLSLGAVVLWFLVLLGISFFIY